MIRETVCGRPVYLTRASSGFHVKWGRTVVASAPDWETAVREIIALFEEYRND